MGLFLRSNENRSELQSRVASELQEKIRTTQLQTDDSEPEPRYLENQHQTRSAGIVISLLAIVLVLVVAFVLAT